MQRRRPITFSNMSNDSSDEILDYGDFTDVYLLPHLVVCSRFADYSPRTLESPYYKPDWPESPDDEPDLLSVLSWIEDADCVSDERDETLPTSAAPTSIDFDYKIDTVTIVSGIDRRIHLARLCDASPHIFGVHSKGELPQCSDVLLVFWLPLSSF